MTDQAREARREYTRRWRAENRDRAREYQRRYWAKKACEAVPERQKPAESGSGGRE